MKTVKDGREQMRFNKTTEGRLMRRRKLSRIKAEITICGEEKTSRRERQDSHVLPFTSQSSAPPADPSIRKEGWMEATYLVIKLLIVGGNVVFLSVTLVLSDFLFKRLFPLLWIVDRCI